MKKFLLNFDPFPYIDNHHKQTIVGAFLTWNLEPHSYTQLVKLQDGDYVSMEISTPKGWKDGDKTVFMIHGLGGDYRSPYLVRMSHKLYNRNVRSIRMNLRGSGTARGMSKNPYHGGMSEDVLSAMKALKEDTPLSPITLLGFSLGGNLALKLAGELGGEAGKYFEKVIGINSPLDLLACAQRCSRKDSQFYGKYFVSLMREQAYIRHKKFPDLPPISVPKNLNIYEYDQLYTAPFFGFDSAADYYKKSSASKVLTQVQVPSKILLSLDDPVIAHEAILQHQMSSKIEVFLTEKGGHMGYIASPTNERGFYWLDHLLLEWIFD